MKNIKLGSVLFILFVSLFTLVGCSTTAYVLTGSSTVSSADAAIDVQNKLRSAEDKRCQALGIGTGAGVGFSADECSAEDTIDNQTIYSVQILVKCPIGVELSNDSNID